MKYAFNAKSGLVMLSARIWGPRASSPVQMALDTGATGTVVSASIMEVLGYDLKNCLVHAKMTSASGVSIAPRVIAQRVEVLGCDKRSIPIVCHNFPNSSSIEGVLGLDFFRGMELSLDFRSGFLHLK